MTVEPRKYAMTKVAAGDWLCPNNEGTLLWRFQSYEEDGSAVGSSGPIVGTFWVASFMPMPDLGEFDPAVLDDWTAWSEWEIMLPTRSDAIASMLDHSERVIASR